MLNILKENRKALQFLHDELGMDFTKPFKYIEGNGKFTLKKIEKQFNFDKNEFSRDYVVALFLLDGWCENDLYYVRINKDFSNIDIEPCMRVWKYNTDNTNSKLNWYNMKQSFNEGRNKEDCVYYAIAQKKEHLYEDTEIHSKYYVRCMRYTIDNAADTNERYKLLSYDGKETVNLISLRDNKPFVHCLSDNKKSNNILDKSGYLIDRQINNLKYRTFKRHREKLKAEVMNTDYSKQNEHYKTEIENLKPQITSIVNKAISMPEIKIYDTIKLIEKYHNLCTYYSEHITDLSKYGGYESCEKVENEFIDYDKMIKSINEIITNIENDIKIKGE